MLDLILPTHKNGYKAHLIKVPALIFLVIFVVIFNLIAKGSISAQDYSQSINIENLLVQHNAKRSEAGLPELTLNPLLNSSAQLKANKMFETNCWSHYCPPGVEPWKYFDDVGYLYLYAGENLAEGFTSIDELMNAWMNSQTHRLNILKPEFKEVGFGLVSGSYQNRPSNLIVTAHFGTQSQLIESIPQVNVSEIININNETSNIDEIETQESSLSILSPEPESVIEGDFIDVNGLSSGLEYVEIYNNATFKGNSDILEGIFTYRIEDPAQGKNIIQVQGNTVSGETLSAIVEVSVNLSSSVASEISITNQPLFQSGINKSTQNLLNLIIVGGLALLFLVDFIVLSRTNGLGIRKSFSHYHFSLLLIVGLLILLGGFGGSIDVGIFK